MTHLRRICICTVALCALCALTATAASAKSTLPEWGRCEAATNHEGVYGNANCTDPVRPLDGKPAGDWEWHSGEQLEKEGLEPGSVRHREPGKIGPATFEATTGQAIHCNDTEVDYEEPELGYMEMRGTKSVVNIAVNFTGCESEGEECDSEFREYGEISDGNEWPNQEGFKGELVYLSGKGTGSPTVGLTLQPFRKPGESYVNYKGETVTANGALFTVICEGALGSLTVGGAGGKKTEKAKGNAAVAVISPVDQMTREFTQTFAQTHGVQEPAPEKGKAKSLQMYLGNENKWVQMGLATTWQEPLAEEAELEIKAVK